MFCLQQLGTNCLLYHSVPYRLWHLQEELYFWEHLCHNKISPMKTVLYCIDEWILKASWIQPLVTGWMHSYFLNVIIFGLLCFSFSYHSHQRQNWRSWASCGKSWHHHQWMDGLLSFIRVNVGHCVICPR